MATPKIEKGQCIHVDWLDSSYLGGGGWVYGDLVAKAKEIESVGFVIDASEDAILIAPTQSSSGGCLSPVAIPFGCIVKITHIEL
jgi:hypothetical protein